MVGDKKPEGDKLVIYDMPLDLIKQWISLTKLFFDNKMWKAMEEAMVLMKDKYSGKSNNFEELSTRIDNVEHALNALLLERKKEPEEIKTFGGGRK